MYRIVVVVAIVAIVVVAVVVAVVAAVMLNNLIRKLPGILIEFYRRKQPMPTNRPTIEDDEDDDEAMNNTTNLFKQIAAMHINLVCPPCCDCA